MKTWAEIRRASTEQILAWADDQVWARAMAGCQQDAEWHAEGDVWTHTRMVIAEVERLPEWPALDRNAQLKLLFTALFQRRRSIRSRAGPIRPSTRCAGVGCPWTPRPHSLHE